MTIFEPEIEAVREAIDDLGCQICGGEATGLTVQFVSGIVIRPCGHLVFPGDVHDMVRCYRERKTASANPTE